MRTDCYDWESLFQMHILERGLDYFEDNLVGAVKLQNDSITAAVHGTETYTVSISFSGGKVAAMHCTCPYAEDGRHCKHMAAVLYYRETLRSGETEADALPAADGVDRITQMVSGAEESVVRAFLTDILHEDAQLRSRFQLMTGQGNPDIERRYYEQRLNTLIRQYGGRDRFITWDQATDFQLAVEGLLSDNVGMMIRYGNYELARDVINYTFLTLPEIDIDDDGNIAMLADACVDAWKRLLEQAGPDVEEAQYLWVLVQLKNSSLDYLIDYLIDFLMDAFHSPEQIQEKLALVRIELQAVETGAPTMFPYGADFWIPHYIRLLEESGAAPEIIEAWCRDRREASAARDYLIRLYTERKDYQQLLQLLQEGAQGRQGQADAYRMQMLQIYKDTGDTEAYRMLLWEMLTEHKQGDLNLYRKLKALYPQEAWEPVREKLFAEMSSAYAKASLYAEEGLYDRLLPWVLDCHSISVLNRYAAQLAQVYPEEILDSYESCLNEMAAKAANRSHYRDWVRILRGMEDLPGGEARVQKIAADWRVRFRNRTAMMDELRKL